jgi:asparagine synthase (glutamine-hydrolysing)
MEYSDIATDDLLKIMQLMDFKQYLPDDILTKVDRASMSVGLETRTPILDHNVIEFAFSIPSRLNIKNNTQKYLLKQILKKYIPSNIINRPKKGFGIPLDIWLKNDLNFLIKKYLNKTKIKKGGIFNWDVIKKELYMFNQNKAHANKIWNLIVFQMWKEKWL